ncbi:MAG: hypothetical protein OEW58_04880 [Gammaproteobacteria bacterium]|nr:hypothetical protein [Gammaproteobacteria bacterium]
MNMLNGQWRELPALELARSHAPVIPYQGKLYIFGGGGPQFKSLDSVVCFNPADQSWQELAPMPTKRSGTAGFLIGDKIYIVGGGFKKPDGNFQFLRTVEIYDPATNRWTTGPDMQQPHDYPAAVLDEGYIYILAGHHPDACLGGPKTDPGFDFCERWKPGMAQWEVLPSLPTPRFAASGFMRHNAIMVAGGVAFTPDGFNNFDFIETYDKPSRQWTQDSQLKLPWPAAGQGMCNLGDTLFFFGGYSTENIHNRASLCPAGSNIWRELPPMPAARAAMGVAMMDNTIYLVGGWADDGRTPVNTVFAYTWN